MLCHSMEQFCISVDSSSCRESWIHPQRYQEISGHERWHNVRNTEKKNTTYDEKATSPGLARNNSNDNDNSNKKSDNVKLGRGSESIVALF